MPLLGACSRRDAVLSGCGVQVSSLLDRDVVYITGRDKSEKSKNGKSANLNNTLQLIYPDIKDPVNPDEFMKVPINELMCLFDADQTCSKVCHPQPCRRQPCTRALPALPLLVSDLSHITTALSPCFSSPLHALVHSQRPSSITDSPTLRTNAHIQ